MGGAVWKATGGERSARNESKPGTAASVVAARNGASLPAEQIKGGKQNGSRENRISGLTI